MDYDVIVVGAGMGGLTAAALLAKAGYKVLVLESHIEPGGCASSYERKRPNGDRYVFDVGATLFTGFDHGGAPQRVGETLGITWPIQRLEPAMDVWLPDRKVTCWGDERWLDERRMAFPSQAWEAERFWTEQERIAAASWRFAARQPPIPPERPHDLLALAKTIRPELLGLVRPMFETVGHALSRHGITDRRLRTFLDAQLLISAQTTHTDCSWLYGAVALHLARLGVYYATGGAWSLARTLVASLERDGGEIRYRHRVERIEPHDSRPHTVICANGERFAARHVIANTTLWDIRALVDVPVGRRLRHSAMADEAGWGACTLYLGVDEEGLRHPASDHHQIIRSYDRALGESNSVFVSMHPLDDLSRAPCGQRAITVSTHTTVERWWRWRTTDLRRYREEKERMADAMLTSVAGVFPSLRHHIRYMQIGTPVSFGRYTRRWKGMVGGLPQRRTLSGLFSLGPRAIGVRNLWLVGDSTFPGQSTAAVSQGALRIVAAIQRHAAD